jgi:hypothetical protein
MTLKNAALLTLIGTILMTALLVWTFVLTFLNVLRDLVPAVTLFSSFIYALGCFSVMVFFYVFHGRNSRDFGYVGSGCVNIGKPLLLGFGCWEGSGRLGRSRGAGSLWGQVENHLR